MSVTYFYHYPLYDSRFLTNPDRALVYVWCESIEEAKGYKENFPDGVIVKAKIRQSVSGDKVENLIIDEQVYQD